VHLHAYNRKESCLQDSPPGTVSFFGIFLFGPSVIIVFYSIRRTKWASPYQLPIPSLMRGLHTLLRLVAVALAT